MTITDEMVERVARALLDRRGFGFYTDPSEGGVDAYEITLEAIDDAHAALEAAIPALREQDRRDFLAQKEPLDLVWEDTQRRHSVYRQENGCGGHTYWCDDIGGGRIVWDSCLDDIETLKVALKAEGFSADIAAAGAGRMSIQFSPDTYRVLETAIALSAEGRSVTFYELVDHLVTDLGWPQDYAEDAVEQAEDEGAFSFGDEETVH